MLDIMNWYIPSKVIHKNSKLPWINHTIKQLCRHKQRYHNKAKSSNSLVDWNNYKDIKRTMQRETIWAFNQNMFKIVYTPYENGKCKKFYRYIKSLHSDCSGIPLCKRMVNLTLTVKIK